MIVIYCLNKFTDVLIIGSGIAGLRASLEASKYSNNVKIISKLPDVDVKSFKNRNLNQIIKSSKNENNRFDLLDSRYFCVIILK